MMEEGARFGGNGKAKVGSNAVEEDTTPSSPGSVEGIRSAVVTTGMAMGIGDVLVL